MKKLFNKIKNLNETEVAFVTDVIAFISFVVVLIWLLK